MTRNGLVALAAAACLALATNAFADTVAVYNADLMFINTPLYVVVRTACISSDATDYFNGKPINLGKWQGHVAQPNGRGPAASWQTPVHCVDNTKFGNVVNAGTNGWADTNFWQAAVLFVKNGNAYFGVFPVPKYGGLPLDSKMKNFGFMSVKWSNGINVVSNSGWTANHFPGECTGTLLGYGFKHCMQFTNGTNLPGAPIFEFPGASSLIDALRLIPSALQIPNELIQEMRATINDPSR